MAKVKTLFVCQECGYESSGWLGKCPACQAWNSFVEERSVPASSGGTSAPQKKSVRAQKLSEVVLSDETRVLTGIGELDRVLGGGIVRGSMVLVGGDPGIGKSTLLLQMCEKVARQNKVLYITGEESAAQVKLRAERLGVAGSLYLLAETCYENMLSAVEECQPFMLVIDSIQTVFTGEVSSAPGSVSQVREVTSRFMRLAKENGIALFIVGHVTKEGAIAGPRVLEHMVDTVLYFEGERSMVYRMLRSVKNRFGSTNEIGLFEMADKGLQEVTNPSAILTGEKPEDAPGSVVTASLEGTRSMLVEIQALVAPSGFGNPRRMASGVDYNRVVLLSAVMEKVLGMNLGTCDVYVNVVGGMKLMETACDLAVVAAVASSFRNRPVKSGTVVLGEVGLTGEVRSVSQLEKRLAEAARSGYTRCVLPAGAVKILKQTESARGMELLGCEHVSDVLRAILE